MTLFVPVFVAGVLQEVPEAVRIIQQVDFESASSIEFNSKQPRQQTTPPQQLKCRKQLAKSRSTGAMFDGKHKRAIIDSFGIVM